jgi:hypothetical protein
MTAPQPNSFRTGPDERGHFGIYGGRFVAETLMPLILDLEKAYTAAKADPKFQSEMDGHLANYVGRPSPLYFAERLTQHCGGAKIYFKREELNHTGAHKVNNVLGQIMLALRMGKKRIIAESLKYALDVDANPTNHTGAPYATGQDAYAQWIKAVENGFGSSHGNWWNATVWGECRRMASSYFEEIGRKRPDLAAQTKPLSEKYRNIADGLAKVSDKALPADVKISTLREMAAYEKQCVGEIAPVLKAV